MLNAFSNKLGLPSPKSFRRGLLQKSSSADSCTRSPPESPTLKDIPKGDRSSSHPRNQNQDDTSNKYSIIGVPYIRSPGSTKRRLFHGNQKLNLDIPQREQSTQQEDKAVPHVSRRSTPGCDLNDKNGTPHRRSASWKGFHRPRRLGSKSPERRVTSFKLSMMKGSQGHTVEKSSIMLLSNCAHNFVVSTPDLQEGADYEVQRIPLYSSYLSDLLEDTEPNHPDYDDLSKAAAKVKAMVKEREGDLKSVENEHKVEGVQDRFPHDDLGLHDCEKYIKMKALQSRRRSAPGAMILRTLSKKQGTGASPAMQGLLPDLANASRTGNTNTNRAYVHEGAVQITNGLQTQDRYLFLFSDLFLVAKQKSNTTFKLKHRIRVCEMWLAGCIDEVAETSRAPEKSFVLGWPTTNVVLTFTTQEMKEVWYTKLKEQISCEKEREQPKTVFLKIQNNDMEGYPTGKTLTVTNYEHAEDIVKRCMDDFHITDGDYKDYQLWVLSGKEESPYPLIGHEEPFSIKMSHIRDATRGPDDVPVDVDANDNSLQCQFLLQQAKKDPKASLDDSGQKRNKKSKRSPMINFFNRRKSTKHDTPSNTAPPGKLFGHSLCEISEEDAIPKPILDMLQQLFIHGPYTKGIFRKSPNQRCCRELREKLDNDEKVNFEDEVQILVIAGALKDFLRSMPDCLLLSDMYDTWIDILDIQDNRQKADKVKKTLEQLPKPHVNLLRHVMCMLYHIDQNSEFNQMNSTNLSICISQSLLFPPLASSTTPSQTDTNKVNEVIQFMIDHVEDIFGESVKSLFGEVPEAKPRQDSSTDSDSMHSLLSLADNHGPRRDDSSIDSLDRDLYNSEIESSPRLLKSHLSNTNLSRDSGLTLSDTQLYNEDGSEMNEYPRVMGSPSKQVYGRSVSQMEEQPQKMVPPEMLSRSYDGALETMGEHTPPVPPPRKNRRRGAETPPNEQNLHAQIGGLHPPIRGSNSMGQLNPGHLGRLPKCDSLGSLDEYAESAESGEYGEIQRMLHHQDQTMMIRKSESGTHLYMNEQLIHGNNGRAQQGNRPAWVDMYDEDTPMRNLSASYESPTGAHMASRGMENLSASYPTHSCRSHEVVFTVTPPDSPDMPLYSKAYHHPPPPYNANRTLQMQSSQSTDGGYESSPTVSSRPTSLPIQRQNAQETTDSSSCETSPALGGSGKVALRSPMDFQRDPTILRKVQKGMTPTGADIFPKHMRNMMRHSLQEEEMKKVIVGRDRAGPVKQNSADSYVRPDTQIDRRHIMMQMRQSRAIEKSASDSSVLDCFHTGQANTESQTVLPQVVERRRPDKPPSYLEAMQRKSQIQNGTPLPSPKEVLEQRANSDRARQLYEASIRKYNEERQSTVVEPTAESLKKKSSPQKSRTHVSPAKSEAEEQGYDTMTFVPEKSQENMGELSPECSRQSQISEVSQVKKVHITSSSQPLDQSHEVQQVHRQSHEHVHADHMIKQQSHDHGHIDNRDVRGSSPYRNSSQCNRTEMNVAQRHQHSPSSEHSKQGSRDSTPVRRNHSHERLARDNRNNQNERPKSRSKSREKRHGHRSSDTRLENSKSKEDKEFRRSNLLRSKSDSQEHLNKTVKFKELKPLDSNIIERCKRAKMEDSIHPTSVDLADLEKPKRIQSVKNKDWHRELAEKYNQVFYQPTSVQQESVPRYAYIKSTKQEANENERPKRRWTPPVHPSKDLILKSGEESRSRRQTPPRTVVKSENDYRNGQQYEHSRKNAVAEKENRPAAHEPEKNDTLSSQSTGCPDPSDVQDFTMGDSNKISWSVARLRNLYDDNKGGEQVVGSSGPFYNPEQDGSRPPPPPYRHPPPINRSSNSSQRRRATEKTNPDAEESYV